MEDQTIAAMILNAHTNSLEVISGQIAALKLEVAGLKAELTTQEELNDARSSLQDILAAQYRAINELVQKRWNTSIENLLGQPGKGTN